jgi:hypothetical protein
MEAPVPVAPSPKFQLITYGEVPPVVVAVKVTDRFTTSVDGATVKLVVRGGGVEDPKISVIGTAAPSLAVRAGRAQLSSIK